MNLCPFCRTDVTADETTCVSCGSNYHSDCWVESGGCVIVGCTGNSETVPPVVDDALTNLPPPPSPATPPAQPPFPTLPPPPNQLPQPPTSLPPPPNQLPPPPPSGFCGGCGLVINVNDLFCSRCGTRREASQAPLVSSPLPPPPTSASLSAPLPPPPISQLPPPPGGAWSPPTPPPRVFPGAEVSSPTLSVETASKSNKTAYLIGLGIVAALLGVIGIASIVSATSGSSEKTLTGSVEVALDSYSSSGSFCTGQGGYSDQRAGVKVAVLDTNGKTVATSTLGNGKVDYSGYTCVFDFKVPDVPKSSDYSVEIGTRSGPDYTYSDLESEGWDITLTLGS